MKKRGTKRAREATAGQGGAGRRVRVGDVLVRAGVALRELVIATGLAVFETMLEEDREVLRQLAQELSLLVAAIDSEGKRERVMRK